MTRLSRLGGLALAAGAPNLKDKAAPAPTLVGEWVPESVTVGGRPPFSQQGFEAVTHEMSVDAFAVALSTVFDAARADGLDVTLALVVDDDALVAEVHDGALELRRGQADQPDVRLEGTVAALREVLWRGRSLTDAEADGSVVVGGLRSVARKFLTLFPPPVSGRTSI